jgi:hypothetical protein
MLSEKFVSRDVLGGHWWVQVQHEYSGEYMCIMSAVVKPDAVRETTRMGTSIAGTMKSARVLRVQYCGKYSVIWVRGRVQVYYSNSTVVNKGGVWKQ